MATYKVIQDIEAEDHLLGPLTLRQFIYGAVAALCGYFCFIGFAKHVYILLPVFLPILFLSAFFAFPWRRDQPTEIWALAIVRFMLLPHRRIWDQAGAKELVTVTAPKKVDTNYTDGLSQSEVKSRLKALADTIDSRGWAIKNVNPADAAIMASQASQSDRLVDLASLPRQVASYNDQPSDDIMDDTSQTSEKFAQMINASEASHRQQLLAEMQAASQPGGTPAPTASNANATPPDNFWFLNQAGGGQAAVDANVITPGSSDDSSTSSADDKELAAELKANKKTPEAYSTHLRTIQPLSAQPAVNDDNTNDTSTDASTNSAAKIDENQDNNARIEQSRRAVEQAQLASNDDLTIATIARQAHKQSDDNEVVISLH